MNLLRAAEFKVGVLILAVASLIAYMSLQVSEDPSYLGRSNEAWFLLGNAGGLVKNSSVRMAGISVGVIKDIKLQDGMARVELTLRPDIKLYVSASVEIKSQGILGDQHVEIEPGSPSDPPLPRKGQIVNVKDKGSLDNIVSQVGDIAADFKEVSKVIKESVTGDGTSKNIFGRIIQNVEKLTADISDMSAANKNKIGEIVDELHSTMKNVDEISDRINKGEGTLGKLISDDETGESVSNAIEGISNMIDTANKTSTAIDLETGYMGLAGGTKTTLNLKIQPGIDRYYLLGVVDDPLGVITKTRTVTTGTTTGDITQTQTFSNQVKINAEFAKNFYDFTIRGGLIENTGGVGFDYTFYRNRFIISLDLFDFKELNVRPMLKYQIWKGVYAFGGVNDALNNAGAQSAYLGAGLFLTNDDLKMMLSKLPL